MRQYQSRPGFADRLKRQAVSHESSWEAASRFGLSEAKVEDLMRKGILVYAYSPKHKKKILVGDGYRGRKGGSRPFSGVGGVLKSVFLFFISGPKTKAEIVVWMLLLPVTFPILFISQMAIAWVAAFAKVYDDKSFFCDDGGGEGLFDEVSTGRREDIQFLLETGPYARENW